MAWRPSRFDFEHRVLHSIICRDGFLVQQACIALDASLQACSLCVFFYAVQVDGLSPGHPLPPRCLCRHQVLASACLQACAKKYFSTEVAPAAKRPARLSREASQQIGAPAARRPTRIPWRSTFSAGATLRAGRRPAPADARPAPDLPREDSGPRNLLLFNYSALKSF